jgi:two-component system chemotaxis sensor kinase CheA
VALILDVFGLAQRAGALFGTQSWAEAKPQATAAARPAERASLLLVQSADRSRMAIPLPQVARLEEFPRQRVERAGGRLVVQHRGQILPLIDVGAALGQPAHADGADETLQVVVCAREARTVGLVVGRILDIVEEDSDVRGDASRPGVAYTTVVQGRVTEMLDVEALVGAVGGA